MWNQELIEPKKINLGEVLTWTSIALNGIFCSFYSVLGELPEKNFDQSWDILPTGFWADTIRERLRGFSPCLLGALHNSSRCQQAHPESDDLSIWVREYMLVVGAGWGILWLFSTLWIRYSRSLSPHLLSVAMAQCTRLWIKLGCGWMDGCVFKFVTMMTIYIHPSIKFIVAQWWSGAVGRTSGLT